MYTKPTTMLNAAGSGPGARSAGIQNLGRPVRGSGICSFPHPQPGDFVRIEFWSKRCISSWGLDRPVGPSCPHPNPPAAAWNLVQNPENQANL